MSDSLGLDPKISPTAPEAPGGLRLRDPHQPAGWFYQLAYNSFRIWGNFYLRFETVHGERLPATGPVLIAPTHTSYLDPPLVGSHLPRPAYYLARETLFRIPILGLMLRNLHVY